MNVSAHLLWEKFIWSQIRSSFPVSSLKAALLGADMGPCWTNDKLPLSHNITAHRRALSPLIQHYLSLLGVNINTYPRGTIWQDLSQQFNHLPVTVEMCVQGGEQWRIGWRGSIYVMSPTLATACSDYLEGKKYSVLQNDTCRIDFCQLYLWYRFATLRQVYRLFWKGRQFLRVQLLCPDRLLDMHNFQLSFKC